MAIDANILLQGQGPDIGNALLRGVQGAEALQMMQVRQQQAEQAKLLNARKLQEQEYLSSILRAGVTASKVKPFIQAKDKDNVKKTLVASGLPLEDVELLSTYADAGRWDQLDQIANQAVQVARDAGVFERDYAAGGGVYTPKDLTLINEYQKALAEAQAGVPGAADRARMLAMAIEAPRYYQGGGGTEFMNIPVTGETTQLNVTPQPGNIPTEGGAGGQMPPSPAGAPGKTPVSLEAPIDGGATAGGAPAPTPGAAWGSSVEDQIRVRDAALAAGKKLGEIEAKKIADLETYESDFRANVAGLNAQFPQLVLDRAVADAPDTSLSKVASRVYSVFLTNDMAAAEADLESFLQSLAETVPFPPGSQSNAELQARLAKVGDIMKSGVSSQRKLEMATRYLEGREAVAKEKKKDAAKLREKYFGSPAPDAAPDAAPAGQGNPVHEVDW